MEDGVVAEIDADKLGATDCGFDDGAFGVLNSAGVEDPETVEGVNDNTLNTDEVVLVVCTCRR